VTTGGGTVGKLYALLVGIDRYRHPGIPHLSGCGNDVEAVRALLASRTGADSELEA
jgi:hypothetical protein